jgi:hypothetical protein
MPKIITTLLAAAVAMSAVAAYAAPASDAARSSVAAKPSAERAQLLNGLNPADDIAPRMAKIKAALIGMGVGSLSSDGKDDAAAELDSAIKEIKALDKSLVKLRSGFVSAERRVKSNGGAGAVDDLRASLASLSDALAAAKNNAASGDELSNFEIQNLMSQYNQSEQLASSVQKKKNDTANAVIQNIR